MTTPFAVNNFMLRDPRSGADDVAAMRSAGFMAVSPNVRDAPPSDWAHILNLSRQHGMGCWPWGRTAKNGETEFSIEVVHTIIETMELWQEPGILNCEKEVDHTGSTVTHQIADAVGNRTCALCVMPTPFQAVDWTPVNHLPVLVQISPHENDSSTRPQECIQMWRNVGFECVIPMYSSAFEQPPDQYNLQTPYHIYTADDVGGDYMAWSSTSAGYVPCVKQESHMPKIGSQDGIHAAIERLRKLDPGGTKPNRNPNDLSTWGAWDKLERTLQILKDDHDKAQT